MDSLKHFFTVLKFWLFSVAALLLIPYRSYAQDVQYSQFYASPLYMNPGFAGSAHFNRLSTHQRLQWPGVDAAYVTSLFSFDKYFAKYQSGFGLMAMQDYQGGSTITSTDITLQYAYELQIANKLTFRPGLQLGFVSRSINYSDLRFPHQYNDNTGYDGGMNPGEDHGAERIHYADVSTGGVLYTDKLWFGVSGHHLTQPNQSFNGEVSNLPYKLSVVGGYRIPLSKNRYKRRGSTTSITPAFHFKQQGKSDQFDLGLYGMYSQLQAGVWYRGIPVKKYLDKLHNSESMVVLLGWKWENFTFGYSYDFTISRLNVARPWGSHELNITYVAYKNIKKSRMRKLPCPDIYDR
jgi:type IX secretion system PorP/SprF family membrane protein